MPVFRNEANAGLACGAGKPPEEDVSLDGERAHCTVAEAGLRRHFPEPSPEIRARFDYELSVIQAMQFSGYFLVVWDFIQYAKEKGIAVGPGRGSAAASLVAYCLGITTVDPMRYGLVFERFLNPGRKSMPDMDIDFADDRRDEVIEYVVRRYGRERVAQIIEQTSDRVAAASARIFERPQGGGFEPLLTELARAQSLASLSRKSLTSLGRALSFASLAPELSSDEICKSHLKSLQRDVQSLTEHASLVLRGHHV